MTQKLTNAHVEKSLIPSLNNLSSAQLERERLISVIAETKQNFTHLNNFRLRIKIPVTETTEMQMIN